MKLESKHLMIVLVVLIVVIGVVLIHREHSRTPEKIELSPVNSSAEVHEPKMAWYFRMWNQIVKILTLQVDVTEVFKWS